MSKGRLCQFQGVCWIEAERNGLVRRTEPGWTGLLKYWKARRYAKRHHISLEGNHPYRIGSAA